jgi:putative ubiquitin-RnfH superfamily antitoxin RatB of RatAB toxin-antitoxin module
VTDKISIELIFAAPDSQMLIDLKLMPGTTIADAITASGLVDAFPEHALLTLPVGVWGHLAEADRVLQDGDRVEIYRELLIDPMESRRLKASEPGPAP